MCFFWHNQNLETHNFVLVDERRRRRQDQCEQTQTDSSIETKKGKFSSMDFSFCWSSPIIYNLVYFLVVFSLLCPVFSSSKIDNNPVVNNTFKPNEELHKLNFIQNHLQQINKPSIKTIQSPDGDIIECVISHVQPAFDHPLLKGQKPLHAVGYVSGNQYYGAKASINVWAPRVANQYEFSLSQMWVISGSFGDDLNTIEAGWQACFNNLFYIFGYHLKIVSPELYGDSYPRFFTYWTVCKLYKEKEQKYNFILYYSFVQTNNKIAIGAAISPTSVYTGGQFDISLLIWKDPKHGNWWLEFGSGILVGYWPSFLFTHLRDHASMVQFGGEIVNSNQGSHTSTQMGSGHFAREGFGKASYFRNLQVVDWDNNLIPLSNLRVLADHPNCYDIQGGINNVWGNYFYYGGPGRNVKCP
ncbi:hypothetical protein RYX36_004914 [Vicia faba]